MVAAWPLLLTTRYKALRTALRLVEVLRFLGSWLETEVRTRRSLHPEAVLGLHDEWIRAQTAPHLCGYQGVEHTNIMEIMEGEYSMYSLLYALSY